MSYQLSSDQVTALQQIGQWYRAKKSPYLTVGGYAGTGKTSLVAYVRQALRENDPDTKVALAAFTGKAVRVLEQTMRRHKVSRRGDMVSTIHSLIYHAEVDRAGHVRGWRLKDALGVDLVIVDEASMVTAELWRDLLSFKIPVLAIGDHGQLPPVGDNFNLMADPNIKLERIFRQNADSPIVQVATLARTTGQIPAQRYSEQVVKYDRHGDGIGLVMEELLDKWRPEWLVLCGFNHTRQQLNQSLRASLGFESPDPQTGDHVICLRNNPQTKLFNGSTGVISHLSPLDNDDESLWWQTEIDIQDGGLYEGPVLRSQFGAKETVSPLPKTPDGDRGDLFDFGYALTVHKAQGSSAPIVLLFEERSRHMSDDDWRRWLYTAVTRAESELYIIGTAPS